MSLQHAGNETAPRCGIGSAIRLRRQQTIEHLTKIDPALGKLELDAAPGTLRDDAEAAGPIQDRNDGDDADDDADDDEEESEKLGPRSCGVATARRHGSPPRYNP